MVVGKPESTREKTKLYSVFCVVLLIDQLFIWHNKKNCKDATTRAPYPFFDWTFRKVYFKFSFASLDRCIAENADGILLCCAWLIILSWLYVYNMSLLGHKNHIQGVFYESRQLLRSFHYFVFLPFWIKFQENFEQIFFLPSHLSINMQLNEHE